MPGASVVIPLTEFKILSLTVRSADGTDVTASCTFKWTVDVAGIISPPADGPLAVNRVYADKGGLGVVKLTYTATNPSGSVADISTVTVSVKAPVSITSLWS